jgi:hypothetical protein
MLSPATINSWPDLGSPAGGEFGCFLANFSKLAKLVLKLRMLPHQIL